MNAATRLESWRQLAIAFRHLHVSADTIKRACELRGYKRYVVRRKPPLSVENKADRLAFAHRYRYATIDELSRILWTDETWVTGGWLGRQYVTRLASEEMHEDCVAVKRKRQGWMFWGSFHGERAGVYLIWEKDWGTVNGYTYRTKIIPLIEGWIRLRQQDNETLVLMQDNAPSHAQEATLDELAERKICVLSWPANSPDLNPIEYVWHWMKRWINQTYGDRWYTPTQLHEILNKAWDACTTPEKLRELLATMNQRCEDVIAADGGYTKW